MTERAEITEDAFARLPRIERREASYRLPAGADVLVRPGQTVGRDMLLARVPRAPLIAPYAADLAAPLPAATAALSIGNGARVRGGEQVGRRRTGLRTQILTAATNGIVTMRPDAGVYTLAPVVPTEVVSRYSGTVRTVTLSEIGVITTMQCLRCGLLSAGATAEGMLSALENPRALPPDATPDVVLVPHLADFTPLRAMARAGVTLVVACTVADAVAWELLTARTRSGAPLSRTPHLAALLGPGEAAEGARVFAALYAWHNRDVWLEETGVAATLCTEAPSGRAATDAAAPVTVILRDPAHWGQTATVVPATKTEIPSTGLARIVRLPDARQLVMPAQNGVVFVDKMYE